MRYILLIIFMISLVNSKEFKNPLSKNIKLSLRDYKEAEQTIKYEYIQVEINSFTLLDDYFFADKLLKEEDKLIQEELEYYK